MIIGPVAPRTESAPVIVAPHARNAVGAEDVALPARCGHRAGGAGVRAKRGFAQAADATPPSEGCGAAVRPRRHPGRAQHHARASAQGGYPEKRYPIPGTEWM